MRGCCTDNAVSAIGILIELIETKVYEEPFISQLPSMWSQWLTYLPLVDDREEGLKTLTLLLRCLRRPSRSVAWKSNPLISGSLRVLLKVSPFDGYMIFGVMKNVFSGAGHPLRFCGH